MADTLLVRSRGRAASIPVVAPSGVLAWTLSSAAMVLALLTPAIWNGFPIIFPDTGGYLTRPMDGTLAMGRSALYGLFLYAGVPLSFWPVVLAQAALMAWLIVLTLRTHKLGGRPWLALAIVAALSAGTSLPWFAGQLMPDILFPAAVLALHLLAFRHDRLAMWERFALAAVIAVAIASHMAALGLCVAVVAGFWLLARIKPFALPKPRLPFAGAAAGAGIALCLLSNLAITGSFAFTPGGSSFLFGRLIEDGIVARYLSERCPDPALRICGYYRDLPDNADDWLWGSETPFYKLGGHEGFGEEAQEIIRATVERYPLTHAATAVADTAEQFLRFKTEIAVNPWHNAPTVDTLAERTPQLMPALMGARQQADPFDVDLLNHIHLPVAVIALTGLAGALAFRRRLNIPPALTALCLTVTLALFANAAICGIFSHPVDRYQSRLIPLAPFALSLVLARRRLPG